MRPPMTIAAALMLLACSTIAADAQVFWPNTFTADPGLTKDDFGIIKDVTAKVNGAAVPEKVSAWTNPSSGNAGTIAFLRHIKKQHQNCNLVRYTFKETPPAPDSRYDLAWCKVDGQWKLAD